MVLKITLNFNFNFHFDFHSDLPPSMLTPNFSLKSLACFFLFVLSFSFIYAQNPGITFEIRNAEVKDGYYEFDVYMHADDDASLHILGMLYLQCDSLTFGSISPKNDLKLIHLDLMKEKVEAINSYKYRTSNVIYNKGMLVISWETSFFGQAGDMRKHTEVPTTPTPLYHVAIKIKNPNATPQVTFNTKLMSGQQFFLLNQSNKPTPYRDLTK